MSLLAARTVMPRLRHHATLLLNAGSMLGSTLSTAVLGFVYWWVAARALPAETVGLASAAIATMGFLALAGDLGLGTLLIGQMARHRERLPGLLSAALLVATAGSALFALLYLMAAAQWPALETGYVGSGVDAALFVAGVALTGLVLVLDQALLGLLRGSWQLARNSSFAVAKLGLLALAVWWGADSAMAVFATWAGGNLLSLLLLWWLLHRGGGRLWQRPELALLGRLSGPILSHHTLNVLTQAPTLLMPVLVTHLLSARINAAFYAAWLLIGVAYLVPASLSTALFAVAANDGRQMAQRLRFSLGLSMGAAVAAITLTGLLGDLALRLFQPAYAEQARHCLWLLALAMPAIAIKHHYIALKRIRAEMAAALPLLALGAVAELGAAAIGAHLDGLNGVATGWLVATCAQALLMGVPLWHVARR